MQRAVAAACVPLLSGDSAMGVLTVGRAKMLTQSDVRLLATLGDMAASALDRVAVLATLEQRVADWDGRPFTSDSESHVSVWRKPS